ncbi:MAG: efflux transporter outer membrane subunit [Betaproteobacteria bacterium]|nr:efflux transporter outer membrane subunit [Betaproteobacteria bacterium]
MNTRIRTSLLLTLPWLLAACAMGPDYARPALDLPERLAPTPPAAESAPPTPAPIEWWKQFNDPALDTLVAEGLARNQDLAAAATRVASARAQAGLALADRLPSVYAAATRERNRNSELGGNFGPGQPVESTTNRATLNVSYELDFWGRYRRADEAARADLTGAEAGRAAVRNALVADLVRHYFALTAIDSQLSATRQAILRGEEALVMQRKRHEVGVISDYELGQRSAEVDAVRAQLPPLASRRGQLERSLAVLLGRSPRDVLGTPPARNTTYAAIPPLAPPGGLASELMLRRPDVIEAEQRLAAAQARIGVARAAYFPTISLTALIGGESSDLADLFQGPARVWNFAGRLTQPLWGGSRVTRSVESAMARGEEALAQYRQAVANAFREARDAIEAEQAAREVFAIEQRRVTSLARTWELAKLRHANGAASQLEVIDAERQLLLAELDRIESERAQRAAIADLYRALGH